MKNRDFWVDFEEFCAFIQRMEPDNKMKPALEHVKWFVMETLEKAVLQNQADFGIPMINCPLVHGKKNGG